MAQWSLQNLRGVSRLRRSEHGEGRDGHRRARRGGVRESPARNNRRISVAPPRLYRRPPSTSAGAARASKSPHYPLTIRNRPTSWLLDLGYNDLTSAK